MKAVKLLLLLLLSLNLTSCAITEKMMINDDGTGKFSYEMDGSQLMSMMNSVVKSETEEGTSNKKKRKKKESQTEREKVKIDSTFAFKDIFAQKKDSIAKLSPQEQEKIKKMENFSMRMIMNEEEGIMIYNMFTDFKSINELQNLMSPVESLQSFTPSGQPNAVNNAPITIDDKASTQFFYDGKIFRKTMAKLEKPIVEQKSEEISEESKQLSEDLKMKESLNMFYEQSKFKIVYQFPKPVKKVSLENALYSEDRKTVTLEFPFKEYTENPEKLNFEVEFE